MLADKAFPELEEKAREQLALNHYLSHLDNPQVAFNVKQKRPANLIDAVGATIEIESYLPTPSRKVGAVDLGDNPAVAAVRSKQDSMMGMLQTMMERLDRLENEARSRPRPSGSRPSNRANPIVCHRCGQEGHFACGCANPRRHDQPQNSSDPPSSNDRVAAIPDGCGLCV